MRRKIPSTTALISFEAAARHESFTKAAQELSLTQGAICRQIASLEAFLSVELFRRSKRGVKLTEAGLSYSRRIATQLDAVERDTLSIMGQQGATLLNWPLCPPSARNGCSPDSKTSNSSTLTSRSTLQTVPAPSSLPTPTLTPPSISAMPTGQAPRPTA